jgi:type IV secretion system protein VirD4
MMNELIELAEKETNLELPRKVLCLWDEFGQIPPIKDFDVLLTAARSRGIRFMTALQSLGQLENKYSPSQAKTIRQAFQETLFSYQSPNAVDTAKEFSAALGSYTTQTGSVSRSDFKDSSSRQLVERKLMKEDEIINMPPGEWVLMKAGHPPVKLHLKLFFSVFKHVVINNDIGSPKEIKTIHYLTADKIKRHTQAKYDISPGQFDKD